MGKVKHNRGLYHCNEFITQNPSMLAGAIYQTHAAHYQVWLIGWMLNAKGEKKVCFLKELFWELEIQLSPHSQAQDSFGRVFWFLLVFTGAWSRTSVTYAEICKLYRLNYSNWL